MATSGETFDIEKFAGDLIYVRKERMGKAVSYGGWNRELLVDKSISTSEEKLLICTLCKGVLRDALVVTVAESMEPRCCVCLPMNHGFLNTHDIIRSVVNERKVHCPVIKDGCKWEGEIGNLVSHLNRCRVLSIPCPLGCSVGSEDSSLIVTNSLNIVQKIPRSKLEDHLANICPMRIIRCDYCQSETEACCINSHLSNCEEYPIECPNRCIYVSNDGDSYSGKIYKDKRKDILDHLYTDCPLQEILCPYSMYGCEALVLRRDMEKHKLNKDFMQQHLDMVEAMLKKGTMVDAREMLTSPARITLPDINSNEYFAFSGIEWRVFDYKKRVTKNFECRSPPFYSSGYKFRFYLTLVERGCIDFYFELLAGEYDSRLPWPLSCELTLKLINKSGNKDLVKEFRSDHFRDQRAFTRPEPKASNVPFGCEFVSIAEIKSRKFSLDGSLLIRFFVKCL